MFVMGCIFLALSAGFMALSVYTVLAKEHKFKVTSQRILARADWEVNTKREGRGQVRVNPEAKSSVPAGLRSTQIGLGAFGHKV